MFKGIAAGALALALAAALASCSANEPNEPNEPSEPSEVSEVSEPGEVAEELDKPFYRPDVNGLTVSEACEKVREAGWRVDRIRDSEWTAVDSHCGDSERIVVRASYYDDEGGESIVDFRFVDEEAPESAVE